MSDLTPADGDPAGSSAKDYSLTGKYQTPLWRMRWFQASLGVLLLLAVASYVLPAGFRLVYATRSVLTPVIVGIALAYMLNPVVTWLYEKAKVPRPVSAAAMLLTAVMTTAGLVLVVVPLVLFQALELVQRLPGAIRELAARDDLPVMVQPFVKWLSATLTDLDTAAQSFLDRALRQVEATASHPIELSEAADLATGTADSAVAVAAQPDIAETAANTAEQVGESAVSEASEVAEAVEAVAAEAPGLFDDLSASFSQVDWKEVAKALSAVFDLGAGAVSSVFGTLGYLSVAAVIISFVFFFTVWRFRDFVHWFDPYIPASQKTRTYEILGMMDRSVSAFIRGRLIQAVIMAVVLTVGLLFTEARPYALLLGVAGGVLGLVPYIGLAVWPAAILVAVVVSLQNGEPVSLVWAVVAPSVVFILAQSIDSYIVEPIVQGKATNLDALTVLLVVLIGGSLAGLLGLLIAIPAAACLKILWHEVIAPRLKAIAAQT